MITAQLSPSGKNSVLGSSERRRAGVAAGAGESERLRGLFLQEPLQDWEPHVVDTFEEARFVLQHIAYDLVVVTEGLYEQGPEGLAWLAQQREVPVVFLADAEAQKIAEAYADGVHLWLPRDLTLSHPQLLASSLLRALEWSTLRNGRQRATQTLQQYRRQMDRLVDILWRTLPSNVNQPWLAQRHLLERLQEEIARTLRHGVPLSVAVGEVRQAPASDAVPPGEPEMADWTTQRILRSKRRCDVAGQYGLQGFALVLVHTPMSGAVTCCRRLQTHLEATPALAGHGPHGPVRAYFGLADFSDHSASVKSILRTAEQRLAAAISCPDERLVGQ